LFTSLQQAFLNLRLGRPSPLPPPVEDMEHRLLAAGLDPGRAGALKMAVVGGPDAVRQGLADFVARHQPDEVIVTAQIYDHAARIRSFEILANAAAQNSAS
jgi:alkanesulfonate monooxygenase SsuD/methylene tetrahydromethanopterin reductase-like flavin-dependent oxidoreductase (luciferase family)